MALLGNQSTQIFTQEEASLSNGSEIDTGWLNGEAYNGFQVTVVADSDGLTYTQSLRMEDGGTVDSTSFPLASPVPSVTDTTFSATFRQKEVRIQLQNNSGGAISNVRIEVKFLYDIAQPSAFPLDSDPVAQSQATLTQSVIIGQNPAGQYRNAPMTNEGFLRTSIDGNLLPFGSIHTESLQPSFQLDAVYGINNTNTNTDSTLSGTVTAEDSNFVVSTGTTQFAQASLQSHARLRYRPGQGIVGRFTAIYDTPVSFSYQVAGLGHAEDGIYFGYRDIAGDTPEFGILYTNRGTREIRTLTVTTGSSTTENLSIELNGVTFNVPVTNSGNIQRTVYEISSFEYAGWTCNAVEDTVVFLAGSAGARSGSYSLSGTTAVGTFAQTLAGTAATEEFIPQSTWNVDKMDGTGGSGVTLNPQKGNVYEFGVQYLGYGVINCKIETANSGKFQTVHRLELPNTLDTTSFRNPSFPFTMAVYSAGSTTDLTMKSGSIAGFIEGPIVTTNNRFGYSRGVLNTVGTGTYHALFTIKNAGVYNGKASQVVVNILGINAGCEDNASLGTVFLIKDGDLVGNPDFQSYSDTSCTLYDTSATEVTFTNNNQLQYALSLAKNGNASVEFDTPIYLQPNECITVAARAGTAILDYLEVSLNTREDQ